LLSKATNNKDDRLSDGRLMAGSVFLSKYNEAGMFEQTPSSKNLNGVPSWVMFVFAAIGISAIGLIFILPKHGFMPLAITSSSLFPVILFMAAIILLATGIISTGRKLMKLSKEIPTRLEALGVQFKEKMSGAIAAKMGTYKDLKLEFTLRLAQKGSPDCFVLTLFHPKKLNLGLLCTNIGKSRFGRHVTLPFYKYFGAKTIDIPGYHEQPVVCWAADLTISKNLFYDDHLKTALISLNEILDRYDARFVLDDNSLKMAFAADKTIDGPVLEAARVLIAEFAQSGKIPLNPPSRPAMERVIPFAVFGVLAIFIAIAAFILINS
jgi:hypothetical protein